jgi:branched-chain amino acid transport system substrate-binding protein
MTTTNRFRLCVLAAGILVVSACSSSSSKAGPPSSQTTASTAASSSSRPLVVGLIASLTGVGSSSFSDSGQGAQARIDAQNAQGGVDGRQLQLVVDDDQSSAAGNATAAQALVQTKGAFGVMEVSAFAFGGVHYLSSQQIPVTGADYDGPEWTAPTSTNMFSFGPPLISPVGGKYYAYENGIADFLRKQGVTKMAALAYGISPASKNAAQQVLGATKQAGASTCYDNESVPFGAFDFTAAVLAIKSAGCNGLYAPFVDASDIALSGALRNAGVNATQLYVSGYDQAALDSRASMSALEGAYITASYNFTTPTGATKTMLDTIARYDPSYRAGSIPDLGLFSGYLAADLMIFGLQHAGHNPTRQSFISNLRQVDNYTAGGIFPSPTSFANFGTVKMFPPKLCTYLVQVRSGKFVFVNGGQPICSTLATY